MYPLYSLLLLAALLIYAPVYALRARFRRRENLHLRERLGLRLPPRAAAPRSLWIHAVSVGEVLSLGRLVTRIKRAHPDWAVYFSTLTETGYRVAGRKLKDADRIFFIPLDFAAILRRAFRTLQPDLLVLAESEFWPNLLRVAHRLTRGVVLVNGRVSRSSFERYRRLKRLTARVLGNVDLFLVQTNEDARRLSAMGLDAGRVKVAGNLKAEIDLPSFSPADIAALRSAIQAPASAKVVVAGSTHRGEDEILLRAHRRAPLPPGGRRLLIAPRHPERADEVERAALALGLRVARRTRESSGDWQVLIIDTIGELAAFYAVADLAFIGGSLVPHGGQNLLEPAFYRKAILFGPHMENFAALASEFVDGGAARVVRGEDDLADAFALADEEALRLRGERAGAILASLQGATEITLREIETCMERPFRDR